MGSYVLPALCTMAMTLKKAHFGYLFNSMFLGTYGGMQLEKTCIKLS